MPSYKPKVQILLTQEYHEKFKALCEKERRSDSVMGAIMIEKYINDYESQHGEITIEDPKGIKREIGTLKRFNASEMNFSNMIKESAQNAKKDYWTEDK